MKFLLPPIAATLFLACTVGASTVTKPNLVIILTDDQGYADVGFNGCTDIPTPHIDSIADLGGRFSNGYVTHPVCGPSRAALLTGRYQGRFGFNTNPSVDPDNPDVGIPHDQKNIAEVLSKVGYTSAVIGKWHMGSHPDHHPLSRGFDYFFGFLTGGHRYLPGELTLNDLSEVKQDWEWYKTRIMENRERVDIDDYLTDALTDAGVRFIRRAAQSDKPFMLYLAYNAPHTPLQATEKYLSRFRDIRDENRRIYAAMVSAVDDGVGRVLETLRDLGLEDNTIVAFLSDNGGARNNASRNTPLRGFKSDFFDGGLRVPFAMMWPGVIPPGLQYDKPVISLDLLGTIAGVTGAGIDPERPLDGVNLIPYLTGEQDGAPHQALYWRAPGPNQMATRKGELKLVANRDRLKDTYQLFDLGEDIAEQNDLQPERQDAKTELLEAWEAWNSELKPQPFPALGDVWWR
ncbi:MAG: sulfatase-like hydrolase/transferase [Verrucomicrobia bacterium]|nr:sulfatase-like hydrolase/transferase [Kiritimatiellia bacterium]MCP5488137.1 sulfatase-like hydrolase/transferase [Verrucomicrobiota bacterium]